MSKIKSQDQKRGQTLLHDRLFQTAIFSYTVRRMQYDRLSQQQLFFYLLDK